MDEKTVVIWDEADSNLIFFVVDGDLRHLNRKYVNGIDITDEDSDKIVSIIYNSENLSDFRYPKLEDFPVDAVKNGSHVVIIGFAP